ncbi:hypothetical protein VTJ04DRAFT_6941 [Mycothermus thermophilus]|uniref:uncharacterized protein n=1 Tax=Humicola insolens TaxID=85995 RepID=UPI003742CAD5
MYVLCLWSEPSVPLPPTPVKQDKIIYSVANKAAQEVEPCKNSGSKTQQNAAKALLLPLPSVSNIAESPQTKTRCNRHAPATGIISTISMGCWVAASSLFFSPSLLPLLRPSSSKEK